jgi:hypothetical protein
MAGVYYCSLYNSTFFTDCCKVAICDDQQKCPRRLRQSDGAEGGVKVDRKVRHVQQRGDL